MKIPRIFFLLIFFCTFVYPQTENLGQGVFYSDEGGIIVLVDASVAINKINSPYVMFMAFLVPRDKESVSVQRNEVVMIYKDQEYKMTSLKEIRDKYKGVNNDMSIYAVLGKEALVSSRIRNYIFNDADDFFPRVGQTSVDTGNMSGRLGFRTKFYFKNPGFKKGDELVFKVKDRKNPEITGQVAVILE